MDLFDASSDKDGETRRLPYMRHGSDTSYTKRIIINRSGSDTSEQRSCPLANVLTSVVTNQNPVKEVRLYGKVGMMKDY